MTSQQRGRRGPYAKTAATRDRILDACEEVFAEKGYLAATLKEVAERAGISDRGLAHHFGTKHDLLEAVLDRHESRSTMHESQLGTRAGLHAFIDELERLEQNPSMVELQAALVAESTSEGHPAHARFAQRHEQLLAFMTAAFESLAKEGALLTTLAPDDLAASFIALADGLHLQWLFDRGRTPPSVVMRRFLASVAQDARPSAGATARAPEAPAPAGKYAKGLAKSEEILQVAPRVVAQQGYGRATIRELASAVGLSNTGLLHYFGSKEALFVEILRRRDALDEEWFERAAVDGQRGRLTDLSRLSSSAPGLAQLHTHLSAEAIEPDHPAHEYFRDRYERTRARTTAMFERVSAEGGVTGDVDPRRNAIALIALLDGLQLQWLYDHTIDMPGEVAYVMGRLGADLG